MFVGARRGGLSTSHTADLLGFSPTTFSKVHRDGPKRENIQRATQMPRWCERSEENGRTGRDGRKATVTHRSTCYTPGYRCWPCPSLHDHSVASSDGDFQQDNAPFHKAHSIWFLEHDNPVLQPMEWDEAGQRSWDWGDFKTILATLFCHKRLVTNPATFSAAPGDFWGLLEVSQQQSERRPTRLCVKPPLILHCHFLWVCRYE